MTKKFYNNTDDVESFAMANCAAMILNRAENRLSEPGRIFKCRTCDRRFETFQALGGHTASHKRPKLVCGTEKQLSKAHKCSICKHEFWTGQALGGHMRKHRTPNNISSFLGIENNTTSSTVTSSDDHSEEQKAGLEMMNDKRILGLDLKMMNTNNFDDKRYIGLDLKMVNTNIDDKRMLELDLNLSPEENVSKYFQF